ncbi:FHA domain-containing protein [Dokdonella sp.]|uniref:FHA domain-containing protein n=1 Tax=Dokdonella sp. TaxID=2291710 RepID=UPI001B16739E|nr:FHA domain-containing protein [Dokdonella sp.]MBO9664243.1 FHA domain-containing protein [Dokdonella sp.]
MQVWSTRKRPAEEAPKTMVKGNGHSAADVWALRVLAGVHAGAERKLQESSFLMIGSSDDCDLIFSDAGVAAHHCIVTRNGEDLAVRAVDAEVRIDDRVLHPGDPQEIKPFSLLRIGGACFALGPHWSERWQTLLSQLEPAPRAEAGEQPPRQRSNRIATLVVAMALMGASIGALLLAQNNAQPPAAPAPAQPRDGELRAIIDQLGYKGLRINAGSKADQPLVSGYVERDQDLETLRTRLAQRNIKAEIDVKSGPQLEADVSESFRLSSLPVRTKWIGEGVVAVEGHFGDRTELKKILASRTIQDLNKNRGLKVSPNNLDPEQPEHVVPDAKRIKDVFGSEDDPYLRGADGATYFKGGKLPSGNTFIGVENGEVLVRDGAGNIQRYSRESVKGALL